MVDLAALVFSSAIAVQAPVVVTLERTTCFGTCPAYSVRITGDGHVHFEGKEFVRVVGPADATIAPESVAALVAEFERIGFARLNERYDAILNADGTRSFVTDMPTTTTSIRIGSELKRVVDYVGAPPALKELERRIDEVARTQQWITVTDDVVRQLRRNGWTGASREGRAWLLDAVERGDADTVRSLLDARADPNAGNLPALAYARDPQIIGILVAAGADVNAHTPSGDSILMTAVRRRRADAVMALLDAGARADGKNATSGQTALQLAEQLTTVPPPRPFPGEPPEPHDEQRIVALLRAAGAK